MKRSAPNITDLIPQRPPFVLVDELLHGGADLTRTSFTIGAEHVLVDDGYITEAGLIENIAQTAATGAGAAALSDHRPIGGGYIGAIKNLEIHFLPAAGSKLITDVVVVHTVFSASVITGKIWCNNKLAAICEMKLFLKADEK